MIFQIPNTVGTTVTPQRGGFEIPPVGEFLEEDVGDVTSASGNGTNFSSTARAITDFVSQLTEVVWRATTEGPLPNLDQDPDSTDEGQSATSASGQSQEDYDSERRQLITGVICLAVVLVLVLLAIGYFFYRVS